jgi:GTP-binding protein
MEVLVPARGLIGFRTEFVTETRGTGVLHHVFDRFEPWHGELRTRPTGGLVADRSGKTTAFALFNLQERGSMFVGPGCGRLRGDDRRRERPRGRPRRERDQGEEADEHALVDLDELVRLIPPRPLPLDQALEFIRDDECVEVTPASVRLRKAVLSAQKRQSATSRKARGLAPA